MTLQGSDNVTIISAGVPNITGVTGVIAWEPNDKYQRPEGGLQGAFYESSIQSDGSLYDYTPKNTMAFDASRCSDIYKNDCNTVQPASLGLIPQIKF